MKIKKYSNVLDRVLFLKRTAVPVTKFDDGLMELATNLYIATLKVKWGNPVGMAANQIGDRRAVFLAEGEVYVNPVIIWTTDAPKESALEGCYSLPDNKDFLVARAPSIRLRWQDVRGEFFERRFNGFHARVIQHEMDHLLGKLCHDR
jgi:peptide deformylase